MGAFEEREEGFERRFALSEELRFKALARRNKRLGLWAAEAMGLGGDAANAFAARLVEAQVGQADDESLAAALEQAFAGAKVEMSEHRIRRKISEATAAALAEVAGGR
jgi:hypothetical protein